MFKIGTPYELQIDSKRVVEFYKKEWQRPIVLGNMNFYEWQFVNVPNQNYIDNCCIAIDDNKNIIGVMGVNKRPFFLNGNKINGGELTTWIVKDEYRNKGVGPKILDFLMDAYEVLIGMGISNAALSVYLRNGFKYSQAIPRYIKVLNWDSINQSVEYDSLAKKVSKYYENKNFTQYKTEVIKKENVNFIFKKFSKINNSFSRNFEYMEWRYTNHPMFKYNTQVVYGLNNFGYGVVVSVRIEEASNGIKILHITDFFGDKNDFSAAINYIIDYAKKENVPIIDFFCTSSLINSYFIKHGWFSTIDHSFFKFPHLFQPIELRNPPTTSLIYWSKNDDVGLYDLGELYLTKQDADFDRPVLGD